MGINFGFMYVNFSFLIGARAALLTYAILSCPNLITINGFTALSKHNFVIFDPGSIYDFSFDPGRLKDAHEASQSLMKNSCEDGKKLIIVDNTHVQSWEMRPYFINANRAPFSYKVK